MSRNYGRLWLEGGRWHLTCEPHVAIYAKRVFAKLPTAASGVFTLPHNPTTCRDLEWFLSRFPLDVANAEELAASAESHRQAAEHAEFLMRADPGKHHSGLAIRPRDYQARAASVYLAQRELLLGDEVGLGKTITTIAALSDPRTRPALVVCPAHLPGQWASQIARFAPRLTTHILKRSSPYVIPKRRGRNPDVIITSYHKLAGWVDVLCDQFASITFDEVQELRRGSESNKGVAAYAIADTCQYRLGLSATPIYNFGGEIWNVMRAIAPGALGERDEFLREWCTNSGDATKARFDDPEAFGAYLRDNRLMIRRSRREVGRELPRLTKVTQRVECDEAEIRRIEGSAGELARILLAESESKRGDRMQAAAQFDAILRQSTGIAKAPYVAAFVRMLLESGEPVVLYGWHRAVYEIWREKLKEFNPAFYTGTESAIAKAAAAEKFARGETDLLVLSLRSGAGLDGLQGRARTVVFGELDWSPMVHHQAIGRVHRDGQGDPVVAYFLTSDSGIDPFMSEILGIKQEQSDGIRGERTGVVERRDNGEAIKSLAKAYLSRLGAA